MASTISKPSPSGRRMSVRQKLKLLWAIISRASLVLPAWETLRPRPSNVRVRSSRMSGSSSTINALPGFMTGLVNVENFVGMDECYTKKTFAFSPWRLVLDGGKVHCAKFSANIEPQSGAAGGCCKKRLEKFAAVISRNPDSCVADIEINDILVGVPADNNFRLS